VARIGDRPRRWPFWIGSIAIHLVMVAGWRFHIPSTLEIAAPVAGLNLALLEPFPSPAARPVPALPYRAPAQPSAQPAAAAAPPAPGADSPPPVADSVTSAPLAPAIIHHDLGDGRLWVRPLPPEQLTAIHRLTRTTAELGDSVARAVVQAYLDSMAIEAAKAPGPPSWTGMIAGARFGLDSRYVYLAGLRIPTVLLGLLPISGGANQSKAFDRSDQLFDDLRRAAARSTTLDDFKAAVRELRAQSELEHRLNEGQRVAEPEQGPGVGTSP
jgi:hypothetical protein